MKNNLVSVFSILVVVAYAQPVEYDGDIDCSGGCWADTYTFKAEASFSLDCFGSGNAGCESINIRVKKSSQLQGNITCSSDDGPVCSISQNYISQIDIF